MNKSESKLIEAFGRARFSQQLKTKGIDVNKMHSDNVKDAEAAKKRAASAQSDLDSFRKKTGVTSESVDDLTGHTKRRLATIIRNPSHPMHSAAKAEMDRRNMTRESFKTFVEATYTDSGWQKPKKDTMSDADGMKKAKKLAKNAVILTKSADALKKKPVAETKGAPKGYHFTRDGKLKKGDAGADGDGGAKLRSDPLDKQRSKIPPIPEKFANPAQQAAVMAKLKKSGKYDGKESKLDELSTKTLTNYKAKADYSREKAQNSAAANYMRGTKGSGGRNDPDIKTMQKRDTGSSLYYGQVANKLRKKLSDLKKEATADPATVRMMKDNPHMIGQKGPGGMKSLKKNTQKKVKQALGKDAMKKEATIPDGQTVMTKKDPVKKNDMDKLAKIRMMLDREKK